MYLCLTSNRLLCGQLPWRRFCVPVLSALCLAGTLQSVRCLGADQTPAAAQPASPIAAELAGLDGQMAGYISEMEKSVASLEALRTAVEKEYSASGDPALLSRRKEIDERIAVMRQSVNEAKVARERLANAGREK